MNAGGRARGRALSLAVVAFAALGTSPTFALVVRPGGVGGGPLRASPLNLSAARRVVALAGRTGDTGDDKPIDAVALFAEWEVQLQKEMGMEELSRWEKEEKKLSLWKRLVAREEKSQWRKRAVDLQRAARAELGRSRQREEDAITSDNSIFSDDSSAIGRRAEAASARADVKAGSKAGKAETAQEARVSASERLSVELYSSPSH
ncbi:hypothetical protein T492DRAFT_888611 [Pavlovales sp. CCMP2436]|nr:hypothetical protein T492DRAFT_888611 [Pavlovales sp. CCMP2436]